MRGKVLKYISARLLAMLIVSVTLLAGPVAAPAAAATCAASVGPGNRGRPLSLRGSPTVTPCVQSPRRVGCRSCA